MDHLLEQLAYIQRQMADSHSDQQLLDQAWDYIMTEIESHVDYNDNIEDLIDRYLEEAETVTDDADSIHTGPRPGTPYPEGPITILFHTNVEEDRWRQRDAEGWVTENVFNIADEF